MKRNKIAISWIFLICVLISCKRKYELSDEDIRWIPYTGTEALVFASNSGELDTIFLKGTARFLDSQDPLDPTPDSIEHFTIFYRYSDTTSLSKPRSNSDFTLVEMHKTKDNSTEIGFGIETASSFFYGLRYYNLKNLRKIRYETIQTSRKVYNDIIIIEPSPENIKYSSRSHFVTKIYWGKSEGIVRFDKKNGIYWELIKKCP